MSQAEQLGPIVMPCGGAGARLTQTLGDLPKVLAPIGGRPLLSHLLDGLRRAGARDVILLAGVGGDRVEEAARALAPRDLRVEIIVEPEPRGTAGALALLHGRLPERFVLAYGGIYAALDWRRLWRFALERGGLGTLVVHRSSHPQDSDLVLAGDDLRLIGWRPRGSAIGPSSLLTNSAIGVFHRDLLDYIPTDRPSDLTLEVLPARVAERAPLWAYATSEYVCDMGTPARLSAVDDAHRSGRAQLKAELALLDRDGVLTPPRTVTKADDLQLLPGAGAAVRALNEAGVRVCVITNQAVVARGLCSAKTLEAIHRRLVDLLHDQGAELDGIYFCPHHPETRHPEGVPSLRGPCQCRKPSAGLVERALSEHGVAPWRALVVGDTSVDVQLAHNAGLACALVGRTEEGREPRHPARPPWRFADLAEVASWVVGDAPR
jgi:histidinol-phosphate phosphatase family protein